MNPSPFIAMGDGQICATRPVSCALAYMALASRRFIAIRACTNTCFPASRDASTYSQCRYGQVPIITASTSSLAINA